VTSENVHLEKKKNNTYLIGFKEDDSILLKSYTGPD